MIVVNSVVTTTTVAIVAVATTTTVAPNPTTTVAMVVTTTTVAVPAGVQTAVEHSIESEMTLSIDLDLLDAPAKTLLATGITEATIHSMYVAGAERDKAMSMSATRLVKVTSRRLTAAAGSSTKAITKIKVASAAAATAAKSKVDTAASAIQTAAVAKAKAVPGIANAIPGGLSALSVSAPVAAVKQVTVTLTTTIAPVPPTNHVADERCRLDVLFLLLMAASFFQ